MTAGSESESLGLDSARSHGSTARAGGARAAAPSRATPAAGGEFSDPDSLSSLTELDFDLILPTIEELSREVNPRQPPATSAFSEAVRLAAAAFPGQSRSLLPPPPQGFFQSTSFSHSLPPPTSAYNAAGPSPAVSRLPSFAFDAPSPQVSSQQAVPLVSCDLLLALFEITVSSHVEIEQKSRATVDPDP